jgi:multidrug efflux pump subunit AcrA (membrane-fusion protein)
VANFLQEANARRARELEGRQEALAKERAKLDSQQEQLKQRKAEATAHVRADGEVFLDIVCSVGPQWSEVRGSPVLDSQQQEWDSPCAGSPARVLAVLARKVEALFSSQHKSPTGLD